MYKKPIFYRILQIIFVVAIVLPFEDIKSQVSFGVGNPGTGTKVRGKTTLKNNTGQTANDVHFRLRQKESWINCNGVTVNSSNFTAGSGIMISAGMPGGNHGAVVTLSGADIPSGGSVSLDIDFWLTKWNSIFIDSVEWTYNGAPIGGGGAGGKGQKVNPPRQGGDGGGGANGAGGRGAQQGGGGEGNYLHRVTIYNEDTIDHELIELKLLASMIYYDSLSDVPWDMIYPVTEIGPLPVLIPANESLNYNFQTSGHYVGGHVYLIYKMASDTSQISMDHPVEEACTFYLDEDGTGFIESTPGWPAGTQTVMLTNMTDNIDYAQDVLVDTAGVFNMVLSAAAMSDNSLDAGDFVRIQIGEGDTLSASYTNVLASDPVPPAPIPTLSQWGLIVFLILMLTLGIIFIYRKN